jgi:hypothetical protein
MLLSVATESIGRDSLVGDARTLEGLPDGIEED